MSATTILRTRARFRPPKIRLHCRLKISLLFSLWDRRLFLHPKSANTRVHLRQYPVSNSVMKNLYTITFRQIPLFDYNFCHKQIAHHEPSLSSTSFISSTTKLFLYTVNSTPSPATWLTSVHSLTKLAENAQSPQHRNITFMKSNNTQYKIEYKTVTLPNKTKRRTMIMMFITTVTKPRKLRFASPCWQSIAFSNRFVLT